MTLEEAVAWRDSLRAGGRKLAVTNGCFDLLHRGHTEYLARAREAADALLVAINSDASVRAIKGPERPVVSESDRAFMLACLESTDAVVVFDDQKPLALLEAIAPDVYVKGGDYTVETIVQEERHLLEGLGATFAFIPFVSGFSTTRTIAKVRGDDE
jgi:rfaE bifunctional protein nucleotidyltransferase chain/domain